MSYPYASNTPNEAAGVTGNSAGAPYSAVGHGPEATTVAEAMAYRQSEIAAHDKPIETDPIGNGIIGGVAGGLVGLAHNGPGLVPAMEAVLHFIGEQAVHFIDKAITDAQRPADDNHPAGGDHGPQDPSLSSAPDSSAHPGMSSSELTCSDPAMSHDPNVSIDTGASHDYAASFDDYNFTPGY